MINICLLLHPALFLFFFFFFFHSVLRPAGGPSVSIFSPAREGSGSSFVGSCPHNKLTGCPPAKAQGDVCCSVGEARRWRGDRAQDHVTEGLGAGLWLRSAPSPTVGPLRTRPAWRLRTGLCFLRTSGRATRPLSSAPSPEMDGSLAQSGFRFLCPVLSSMQLRPLIPGHRSPGARQAHPSRRPPSRPSLRVFTERVDG